MARDAQRSRRPGILLRSVPLGRAGQPLDLAEAAYFLCSPHAGFITGANLVVDGGESLL
jgi:NAD(P)-dependent dehydrogenase (short-subunit alcohol dehydrogenase family)